MIQHPVLALIGVIALSFVPAAIVFFTYHTKKGTTK
jgi:hypothetical protein